MRDHVEENETLGSFFSGFPVFGSLGIVLTASFIFLQFHSIARSADIVGPKNMVYIMLDDADHFDFGFNNGVLENPDAVTPNIDQLRSSGQLFRQYYAASSVCTPTRVSVLTGCNPIRFGATLNFRSSYHVSQSDPSNSGLPDSVPQMGFAMKALGKATGFFGKWHVGLSRARYRPDALGFDYFTYLRPGQSLASWSGPVKFQSNTGIKTVDVDHVDDHFVDHAIDMIEACVSSGREFYIHCCPFSPHYPWTAPRNFDNSATQFDLSTNRGNVLAMMHNIDAEIGRIVNALDDLGIRNNTMIVLTSDNGGQTHVRNADRYYRGAKGNFFEGGIHVPMIASWPSGIPLNTTNESFVTSMDLLPTFVDVLGGDSNAITPFVDGKSVANAFLSNTFVASDPVLWLTNGAPNRTEDERSQYTYAVRSQDKKLIKAEGRSPETNPHAFFLYEPRDDPRERSNRRRDTVTVGSMSALAREMRRDQSRFENFRQVHLNLRSSRRTLGWILG